MTGQTLALAVSLPSPWPVAVYSKQLAFTGDGFDVAISYTPFGQVAASVNFHDGKEVLQCFSPKVIVSGLGIAELLLVLIYDDVARSLSLSINGLQVHASGQSITIAAEDPSFQNTTRATTRDDIGISTSLKRREQRATDYRKNRTNSQLEQCWTDLGRECRLLRKATDRLKLGDTDEVVTVSLHLRKLIGSKSGDHVLQDCAALKSKSMLIWTEPPSDPVYWTPVQIKDGLQFWDKSLFTLTSSGINSHLTDLDVWLNQSAGVINEKEKTNLEKLVAIADKIGAHLDPNREQVSIMDRLRIRDATALTNYLINLADLILTLAIDVQESSTDSK